MTTERDLTRLELLDLIEQLEDEYQEVARALGCEPSYSHENVLERARAAGAAYEGLYRRAEMNP